MKHPTIYRLSTATAVITLSLFAIGEADAYTYSQISDDSILYNGSIYNIRGVPPAINNRGTIAFQTQLDVDIPRFDPELVIFTDDGTSLTRITQALLRDINDNNTVLFAVQESSPRNPRFDLDIEPGFINTGLGLFDPSNLSIFGDVAINNQDSVVYRDNVKLTDSDLIFNIFTSNGENRTTIADDSGIFRNFGDALAINNQGTVALEASLDDGGNGIFTVNGDSIIPIADTNGSFSNFGPLSLNDADTLAFRTFLDDGGAGIFTSNGNSLTTIADTSGTFISLNDPAINNDGTVAFYAQLNTGEYGIFTGTDPVDNKVIATGDPLFNSTVTSLGFSNKGFNDAGQVAFWAKLDDGSSGIFRADPDPKEPTAVPEPTTGLGLLVISTIGVGSALRHKQK